MNSWRMSQNTRESKELCWKKRRSGVLWPSMVLRSCYTIDNTTSLRAMISSKKGSSKQPSSTIPVESSWIHLVPCYWQIEPWLSSRWRGKYVPLTHPSHIPHTPLTPSLTHPSHTPHTIPHTSLTTPLTHSSQHPHTPLTHPSHIPHMQHLSHFPHNTLTHPSHIPHNTRHTFLTTPSHTPHTIPHTPLTTPLTHLTHPSQYPSFCILLFKVRCS